MTLGEREFLLARQYAHLAEDSVLLLTLAGTTLFVFAAALAVLVSDRIGFRRDDDPLARLPLVGTFLGIAVLLLYPAYNLARTHRRVAAPTPSPSPAVSDPSAGVRLFVRRAGMTTSSHCAAGARCAGTSNHGRRSARALTR